MMRVRQLFISPGHAYRGGHGPDTSPSPMLEREAIECVAGQGIRGDRYFGFKEDYKGQITFLSWSVFCDLRRELSVLGADVAALRRNVITDGVNLAELVGKRFELQGVTFDGVEICQPCHWMDRAIAPGAEAWLKDRGGLRARIVSSGWIRREATEAGRSRRLAASDWPENEFD